MKTLILICLSNVEISNSDLAEDFFNRIGTYANGYEKPSQEDINYFVNKSPARLLYRRGDREIELHKGLERTRIESLTRYDAHVFVVDFSRTKRENSGFICTKPEKACLLAHWYEGLAMAYTINREKEPCHLILIQPDENESHKINEHTGLKVECVDEDELQMPDRIGQIFQVLENSTDTERNETYSI